MADLPKKTGEKTPWRLISSREHARMPRADERTPDVVSLQRAHIRFFRAGLAMLALRRRMSSAPAATRARTA